MHIIPMVVNDEDENKTMKNGHISALYNAQYTTVKSVGN